MGTHCIFKAFAFLIYTSKWKQFNLTYTWSTSKLRPIGFNCEMHENKYIVKVIYYFSKTRIKINSTPSKFSLYSFYEPFVFIKSFLMRE